MGTTTKGLQRGGLGRPKGSPCGRKADLGRVRTPSPEAVLEREMPAKIGPRTDYFLKQLMLLKNGLSGMGRGRQTAFERVKRGEI